MMASGSTTNKKAKEKKFGIKVIASTLVTSSRERRLARENIPKTAMCMKVISLTVNSKEKANTISWTQEKLMKVTSIITR